MAAALSDPDHHAPRGEGRLWAAYAGLCLLCWALYAMAGTEWQRGPLRLWEGLYDASWNLGPPMLLGAAGLPWMRWVAGRPVLRRLAWHLLGATAFVATWQALDYATALSFFGPEHADATFQQHVLWRSMWGVFVYVALVVGFGGALHARRAQQAAVSAARAEAALVRAELAAITGKLDPHFLFNTLNTLIMLTRCDAAAAEQALLRYARLMRYVLDTRRGSSDRVTVQEELDFIRDYLELEALRLGSRLRVDWQIDPATVGEPIPPLSLQPLVENSIVHGIAPQVAGGTVRIETQRLVQDGVDTLALRVSDDGAGCSWPRPEGSAPTGSAPTGSAPTRSGVGLSALRRRFELDFGGRARFGVRSAPGQGFQVEILIPHAELQA